MLRNPLIQFAIMAIGIMSATYAAWSIYSQSLTGANIAVESLNECRSLIAEIERFNNAPRIASLDFEPPDHIAARITKAAKESLISPLSIQSIDPQSAGQFENTAYKIRPTNILLQNATLAQTAAFIMNLEDAQSGTIVRDLTMRRSDAFSENDSELWNVRMTLTQVIYSPISTK